MSNRSSTLPPKDTVKLYFTLGLLGSLWFAVISTMLENSTPSNTQLTTIGVLAVLTVMILFYFDRTSEEGLISSLKAVWPFNKLTQKDEPKKNRS